MSRNRGIQTLSKYRFSLMVLSLSLLFTVGCVREEEDLQPATFPNTAEVFIDTFSPGLEYAAFGESKLTAFTVDEQVSFEGNIGNSSMRFDVPNFGDPEGPFAGGVFLDPGGRDLSGYNALTFYAQATQAATVDLIGFGNDFGDNEYFTTTSLRLSTNWTKYIIPIPDASKLTEESGLFIFSDGPDDGDGYTVWIDVVQFEKLGTLAQERPAILDGEDVETRTFVGLTTPITDLSYTVNLPNGGDQTVNTTAAFFSFTSSDSTVAMVNEAGLVSVIGEGTAVITASLKGVEAAGSLTVISSGEFSPAPVPDRSEDQVISVFSDAYTNVPVDFYNGFFEPFQTTQGGADLVINGDNIIRYTQLNFVATQFTQPTINAADMTHLHVDLQVIEPIEEGDFIRIELVDFGPDGAFGGGDDSSGSITFNSPPLTTGEWAGLDIPLEDFAGLTSTMNLAQILFVSDATISAILVDNMYFYQEEGMVELPIPPVAPAPDPTELAENVISVYSDAYQDVPNLGFNLYGAATFEEVQLMGNASLKYTQAETDGGNFQVIELGGNQIDALSAGMTNFRFDIWFPNPVNENSAFLMKVVDIPETGLTEGSININATTMPAITQGSWLQFDIPLADLQANGLGGLSNIQQFVIDLLSSGEVYIDNIYFYKEQDNSGPLPPTMSAPAPSQPAENVISIYSDAYTNVPNAGFNLYGAAAFEEVQIMGNAALRYTRVEGDGGNFQVIELGENQIDAQA
ncbi:hypothetical protein [Persicobacter diffluens]|uniref:BIG2 domain-containing protein n=1 Tax=Persicobacter diffluens TaxID=981 RepID=A0AAN5ANL5_9BACT|nr:hypothetical protein PEDI_35350 [Persicobacter diffluens]